MIHLHGKRTASQCLCLVDGWAAWVFLSHNNKERRIACEEEKGWSWTHLLQTSTLCADKGNTVAVVDVGGDRSHAVPSLSVESVTRHQLRPTERLVDVQTAERVVNWHRLQMERKTEVREEILKHCQKKVKLNSNWRKGDHDFETNVSQHTLEPLTWNVRQEEGGTKIEPT